MDDFKKQAERFGTKIILGTVTAVELSDIKGESHKVTIDNQYDMLAKTILFNAHHGPQLQVWNKRQLAAKHLLGTSTSKHPTRAFQGLICRRAHLAFLACHSHPKSEFPLPLRGRVAPNLVNVTLDLEDACLPFDKVAFVPGVFVFHFHTSAGGHVLPALATITLN